jgi:hypothetical protein
VATRWGWVGLNYYSVVFPYAWHYTLFVAHVPCKFIFNDSYSAIFLQSFGGSHYDMFHELFVIVFPYLVLLGSFGYNVWTYVKCNPFGNISNISCSDFHYKMLFGSCNGRCEVIYYINAKFKKKSNIFVVILTIIFFKLSLWHKSTKLCVEIATES